MRKYLATEAGKKVEGRNSEQKPGFVGRRLPQPSGFKRRNRVEGHWWIDKRTMGPITAASLPQCRVGPLAPPTPTLLATSVIAFMTHPLPI